MTTASIRSFTVLSLLTLGLSQGWTYAEPGSPPDAAPSPPIPLTVYIDDDKGIFYPESEWTRENLLQSALHDASRRTAKVQIKDLRYNEDVPEAPVDVIALRIHSWRRGHSGFYEFRGAGHYFDAAGVKHSLGTISGTQSSLKVFSQFDVRDAFEEVVEMAFLQAFRKIERMQFNPT